MIFQIVVPSSGICSNLRTPFLGEYSIRLVSIEYLHDSGGTYDGIFDIESRDIGSDTNLSQNIRFSSSSNVICYNNYVLSHNKIQSGMISLNMALLVNGERVLPLPISFVNVIITLDFEKC